MESWNGPPVSPFAAGLQCRCPRCGQGALFSGYLTVTTRCSACAMDCSRFDSGDGPAFFVMVLVGFIAVPVLVWLGMTELLPLWALALFALVLVMGLSLALLRPVKALLIALEHANKAREGRLDEGDA